MSAGKFKLELEFDHDELRSIVRGKFVPAIEAVLANSDVERLIREKLVEPTPVYMTPFFNFSTTATLLDNLISEIVRDEAKAFVERTVRENRPSIEEAFMAMLRGSEKKLSRAFCEALVSADWHFNLAAEVVAPSEGDSDD